MWATSKQGKQQTAGGVNYPGVGLLSLGHFANDMCGNLFTSLTPYLVLRGVLSASFAGVVVLFYLLGSSVLQPIFGLMADRSGKRWFATVGPLWVGASTCFLGWVTNSFELMLLAVVGGVGTAAFHPQAAAMVNVLSPRNKGRSMSFFSLGGNVGFALGPVLAAAIALNGMHWSLVALIPGVVLAILMGLFAPRPHRSDTALDWPALRRQTLRTWRPLTLVVGVIAVRSAVQFALILFLPLYYHARGLAPELGSYSAFVFSLAGAFGGVLGGHLSDVYSRRLVMTGSLLMSVPLLALSLATTGPLVWIFLAASGTALLASNSVTVVRGQELLPDNTGLASGLTMGLGFGLSGVFASALTAMSDHTGVTVAIYMAPVLALVAAGAAAFIPDARAAGHEHHHHAAAGGMRAAGE